MEHQTKVVIVNSGESLNSLPTELLGDGDGYEIAGFTTDTSRAAELIRESLPDVVLADLAPSATDGLTLLKAVDTIPTEKRPRVLMISGFTSTSATARRQNPSTAYWISKLCEKALLASEARSEARGCAEQSDGSDTEASQVKAVSLKRTVAKILDEIGISEQTSGYTYLHEAILTAVENMDAVHSVTKDLYPAVARKFFTTSGRVERAIRHAVEAAWDAGALDTLHRLYGSPACRLKQKPSSSEFIGMIAGGLFSERKCSGI